MQNESRVQRSISRKNTSARGGLIALVALLGAAACGSAADANADADAVVSVALENGNVVTFEELGDGISVTEVGPASNGSHLSGRSKAPADLFRELAPGRAVPDALLAYEQHGARWENLRPGTLVFPSREAFEKFDMATLDRSKLDPNGPTWMGEGPAPVHADEPAVLEVAPPRRAAFRQDAGACATFIQSQCNLANAGMNGSAPDEVIVLPNEDLRIDDADVIRGHHSMCAADGNGTLRVFVPEHPTFGTGTNTRRVAEGTFLTTVWEHPLDCIEFDDEQICFLETTFVSVDVRTEVFGVGSFHYCRAYDSNPN